MSAFSLEFLSQELAKSSFFESSQGVAMFLKLNDSEFSISNDSAIKILQNNKKLDDWLILEQAFSSSNLNLCIEYAKLHKCATNPSSANY